jgi:hypothetical protein
LIGVICIVLGLLARYTGLLHYFGRLPGDIHIQKGNFRIYIPFTTMIIISLILSILIRIFRK